MISYNSIPNRALFDYEINHFGKLLVPNFVGVYDREEIYKLKKIKKKNFSFIINLDNLDGEGTHWVAIRQKGNTIYYFDSFGNLPPPEEIVNFSKNKSLFYNTKKFQSFNKNNCGKLSLQFLINTKQIQ